MKRTTSLYGFEAKRKCGAGYQILTPVLSESLSQIFCEDLLQPTNSVREVGTARMAWDIYFHSRRAA